MSRYVIGVDPGMTTGICLLDSTSIQEPDLIQCTPGLVNHIVTHLITEVAQDRIVLAVEKFVVGPRASRLSTPKAGQTTRELIGAFVDLGNRLGIRVVQRSASEVKPWATDIRLKAAGIWTKGMPHAHDAGRHALFSAVRECGLPDPLSSRSTRKATP